MVRVLLVAIASLLVQGCSYLLFPPDTFKDMWLRADALDLPEDFVLVYREQDGLRSTFAAASNPEVTLAYAARWDDGNLCDRLRSLAGWESIWPTWDESIPENQRCDYTTRIAVGWRAWPVNVWSVTAFYPDGSWRPREDECLKIRADHETSELGTYLRPRDGACWVPPGASLVRITIRGGRDWFIPAV
jgi:hypothetical protein